MKNESKKTRTECDLLGCVEVPDNVLYGVQTMRGLENFAISKFRLCEYPRFIEGLAIVKLGAAIANHAMGLLSDELFGAISQACREIMAGRFHEFFPVDMIQGGAGTTTNMNANEVIANRALEIMGHARGEYQYCSPNDHVNCSQSTNDAYPSAIHLGLYATHLELRRHLEALIAAFGRKGDEFARVLKMGRTQLQDAVPMTLGQTFHGFASVLRGEVDNLDHAAQEFLSINMGATAIVTHNSLPMTLKAIWFITSGITGLTLPGMIDEPGWRAGRLNSPSPQRGPDDSSRRSLQILFIFDAMRFIAEE